MTVGMVGDPDALLSEEVALLKVIPESIRKATKDVRRLIGTSAAHC